MLSLTATELPRFMACNGSRLLGGVSPFDTDRTLADEGDAAHWLIEQVFNGHFSAEELVDRKAPNGVFITADMVDDIQEYLTGIKGFGEIECNTSYAGTGWEIRGRTDHIFYTPAKMLVVSDFKYGWRIVEPKENWTLISHALGYIFKHQLSDQINSVVFRIYQPRPYHPEGSVREWVISYTELLQYWQQLQAALSNPTNTCQTSEHCYKCPSRSQCPAAQIASMNAVDVAYAAYDSEVDNDRLAWQLDNLSRAQEHLKQMQDAYEDLAMHRLQAGQSVGDYAVSVGKGKTRWNEGMTADLVAMLTGFDVSKKELVTPTQAGKLGISPEVLSTLTNRPNTGVKLVKQSVDKRATALFGKKGN